MQIILLGVQEASCPEEVRWLWSNHFDSTSASKTRTCCQVGLFSWMNCWCIGRDLVGVVRGLVVEEDVQGHVKIAVVHRPVQMGVERSDREVEDTGMTRQILLAVVHQLADRGGRVVVQGEKATMSQHGGASSNSKETQVPITSRIVSWFTGRITPFSVMMPAISSAGVTSKAGL